MKLKKQLFTLVVFLSFLLLFSFCKTNHSSKSTFGIPLKEDSTNNYSKKLKLNNFSFSINAKKQDTVYQVTITPKGLELINRPESFLVNGPIINSEIIDLNKDGSPEILIYSVDNDKYTRVHGFSVNNKKSMSRIYFPPIENDKSLLSGYNGYDKFTIEDTNLIQNFPVYEEHNLNTPTGLTRKITYKLIDGESSRRFEVFLVEDY